MLFFRDALVRIEHRVLRAQPHSVLLAVLVLFGVAFVLMRQVEGDDSALRTPWGFLWWFVVTTFTVGYGDSFPTTHAGQLVGMVVIVVGIALMTTLVATLATLVVRVRGRMLKGRDRVTDKNTVLVVGYHPGRTEQLIDKVIRYGERTRRRVVLVVQAGVVSEHPMADRADRVRFVTGDIRLPETMQRAGVARAAGVIIDVGDDDLVLPVLLAVRNGNPRCPVVAALVDTANDVYLEAALPHDADVASVERGKIGKIAHEVLNPGVNDALNDLEDPENGEGATFRLDVRGDVDGIDWLHVGQRMLPYGAVPLALIWSETGSARRETCPGAATPVRAGMAVIYASRRALPDDFGLGTEPSGQ